MRYAQGGGLTPGEQEKRERLRLEAAERFACGDKTEDIAKDLRVTARSVRRWRRAWGEGGADALQSRGPMAVERLSPAQWARLERELQRGPLAHGWHDESQGWTLKRVKLLIGRMFHVGYTVQGVWKLLRRHGWSAQVPVRRAIERDDEQVEVWKAEVWPQVKAPRRTWAPRGMRPVVRVRGSNRGRVNIAGAVCFRPGERSRFFYRLRVCRGRKGERKAFTWDEYRDLIVVAHLQLKAPVVWCWDNLNVHLARELADFARENKEWLRVFQLPSYAPELNPAEGVWSLLKRSLADFAAADLNHLGGLQNATSRRSSTGPI